MTGVAWDELEITDLLFRWGQARDSDDWQTLAACFHDDATIQISWMSGSARDFLEGSKNMAATRPALRHISRIWTFQPSRRRHDSSPTARAVPACQQHLT